MKCQRQVGKITHRKMQQYSKFTRKNNQSQNGSKKCTQFQKLNRGLDDGKIYEKQDDQFKQGTIEIANNKHNEIYSPKYIPESTLGSQTYKKANACEKQNQKWQNMNLLMEKHRQQNIELKKQIERLKEQIKTTKNNCQCHQKMNLVKAKPKLSINTLDKDEKYQFDRENIEQIIASTNSLINMEDLKMQASISYRSTAINPQNDAAKPHNSLVVLEFISLNNNQSNLAIDYLQSRHAHCFGGDVLEDEQNYKEYLSQVLERFKGRMIKKTRLLYRYDANNSTNIHSYVDDKPDIVLLAKTESQYHLACYSESAFAPKLKQSEKGLIISLTNRKCYQVQSGKRASTYDSHFLIFGNSEVRVKATDSKLFSNFGTLNGYYAAGGDKINALLGDSKDKETNLTCFEVHQIFFR